MIIFDGYARAEQKEQQLTQRVARLREQGKQIKIAAVLFTEDKGSQLYTRLKSEAAERVGIEYQVSSFSLLDDEATIIQALKQFNQDPTVTGIIIQKPSKRIWLTAHQIEQPTSQDNQAFQNWWQKLVTNIDQTKDVDGLHPDTLTAIEQGTWKQQKKVMPATAKAVMEILGLASQLIMHVPMTEDQLERALTVFLQNKKAIVIGKSDIVGKPVFYALTHRMNQVEMIGSTQLQERITRKQFLHDADIVISSTGRRFLITEELIKKDVVLIDVGEPMPDVDQASVREEAAFLTPVPGGVGPMTVICLLENAVELVS